jgi:hypothetical protein
VNLLNYLRAKRGRRKPELATGGFVQAPTSGDVPIVQSGCSWVIDTKQRPLPPDAVILQMRGYIDMTPEDWQRWRSDLNAIMGKPRGGAAATQSLDQDMEQAPPNG